MCNKFNRRVTLLPRLAKEGLVLEQSYVQPICTPTRCTFKCSEKNVSDHEGRHWWAGGTQFTPGGSTAFFGQRNLEGCTHLSPSCQGNVQSRSIKYLAPCFLGCSSSKAMQLTWWESGTLVSAAKRCCPPVGWSQFQCSQFQWVNKLKHALNCPGALTLSMATTLVVNTTSTTQGDNIIQWNFVPLEMAFWCLKRNSLITHQDAVHITCKTGLRSAGPGWPIREIGFFNLC